MTSNRGKPAMKFFIVAFLLIGAILAACVPAAIAKAGTTTLGSKAAKERCFDRSNSRRFHQQYCSGQ